MSVSVIIPARNDSQMLARCLDALHVQTRPADEIIVVDNGSTDDTADVARARGATVISEPVQGITRATAAGFDAARGDIIARVDADSLPPSHWLQRIADELRPDADPVAVTGPGVYYGGNAFSRGVGRALYLGGYFHIVGLYLGFPPLYGSNFAMRRTAWLIVGPRIHRDIREVHDDLEISLHLDPDMVVKYLPDLPMPISARPFDSWEGLVRRVRWGFGTLALDRRDGGHVRRRSARADCRVQRIELNAGLHKRGGAPPVASFDDDAGEAAGAY